MAIDANAPGPEEPSNDDYMSIFIEDVDTVANLGGEKVKFFTVFFDDGHTENAFPSVPNNTAKVTPAQKGFEESLEERTPDEGFRVYCEFERGSVLYKIAFRDHNWLSDDVEQIQSESMPPRQDTLPYCEAIPIEPKVFTAFTGGNALAVVAFMKDKSKKLFYPRGMVNVRATDPIEAKEIQGRVCELLQTQKTSALLRLQRLSGFTKGFPFYYDGDPICEHKPSCRVICKDCT